MKKTTLFTIGASLLLAVPSIVQADAGFKSGFKVGLGAGYKNHRVKSKTEYDASAVAVGAGYHSEKFVKSGADNTANFEIHGGYDFIKDRFLAAVDLNYRYSPTRNQISFNASQDVLASNEAPFTLKHTHSHDFGLSLNAGALATSNFAIYAIGNVRLGRFERRFENYKPSLGALERIIKKSQYRWGLGGGLGCRYALTGGLSIGVDATYDIYQKVKTKAVSIVNQGTYVGDLSTASHRPRIINVLFKDSKTF